jgi:hypothetical protein
MAKKAAPSISKAAVVRAAFNEGITELDDIVAYVKAKHGYDMRKAMASAYEAQTKAKENHSPAKRGRNPAAAKSDVDLLASLEAMKRLIALYGPGKAKRWWIYWGEVWHLNQSIQKNAPIAARHSI